MHPITINTRNVSLSPERFALIISYEPPTTRAAFLYALADDLATQALQDEKRGYHKIASDMTGALPHLEEAAKNTNKETIDERLMTVITPYAKKVGALRYDAMITFLETYATITNEQRLLDAAYCVKKAWQHTPRSWKKIYAPETIN